MAIALFGVDEEASIPTWWSSAVLCVLGIVTGVVGVKRAESRRSLLAWWMLAAAFLLMSLDEVAMLHERAGYLVDTSGSLHHARWIVLWLPLAGLIGIPIFFLLWRSSQQLVTGLVIGAVVFLSGAVGVEMVNSTVRYDHRTELQAAAHDPKPRPNEVEEIAAVEDYADKQSYGYLMGVAVEELLEMLGVVIWLAVVLNAGLQGNRGSA